MTYPTPKYRGLDRVELEDVTSLVTDRLRDIVDTLDRETYRRGLSWYGNANAYARKLAEAHDVPFEYVVGIIAALSPRISWSDNLKGAESILADGEQASTMALGTNVVKALWIANGSDAGDILGGRKVRSFWRNISAPYDSLDVTLDGWMVKALGLPSFHYLERKGTYDAIADGFHIVAAEHGILPHQLQAAVWIQARGQTE